MRAASAHPLRPHFEALAELMDEAEHDVLVFMIFPADHWRQIHSTNPLERLNAEVKKRIRVVGIFPNDRAIIRLVGALMLEQNNKWAVSRRYMSLETMAAIGHDGACTPPDPKAAITGNRAPETHN